MRRVFRNVLFRLNIIVAVLLLFVSPQLNRIPKASAFAGGTGTSLDPYQVADCLDLAAMDSDPTLAYILTADIDCTLTGYSPVGSSGTPFSGTFDGQGHMISGITLNIPANNIGLFGYTNDAVITDVILEDSSFTGQGSVGSLIGYAGGTDISKVYVRSVTVSGNSDGIGGMVGKLGGAQIQKSAALDVNVHGDMHYVGGLVGWIVGPSSVADSYATGEVTGDYEVGGLVGQLGVGPAIVTTSYADISFSSAGSSEIGSVAMGGMPSYNFTASAPYIGNSTASPLDHWDFDEVWYVRTAGYPALRPFNGVVMLCNAPSATDTTMSASCTTDPTNLETTITWEIQYRPTLRDEWIVLPNQVGDLFSTTVSDLLPGTDYKIRFRHISSLGTSEWGSQDITTTGSSDTDGDGVSNLDESETPNSGDANDDGDPDYTQAEVVSTLNETTGKYATVETSCHDNFNVQIGMESSEESDEHFDYPAGLVSFVGRDCGVGANVDVSVYFYDEKAESLVVRKHTADGYMAVPATLSDNTIDGHDVVKARYQITDGGELDDDGELDGNIVDPVGLASALIEAPNTGIRPASMPY